MRSARRQTVRARCRCAAAGVPPGSILRLRKLAGDYDVNDRVAAQRFLAEHHAQGEARQGDGLGVEDAALSRRRPGQHVRADRVRRKSPGVEEDAHLGRGGHLARTHEGKAVSEVLGVLDDADDLSGRPAVASGSGSPAVAAPAAAQEAQKTREAQR